MSPQTTAAPGSAIVAALLPHCCGIIAALTVGGRQRRHHVPPRLPPLAPPPRHRPLQPPRRRRRTPGPRRPCEALPTAPFPSLDIVLTPPAIGDYGTRGAGGGRPDAECSNRVAFNTFRANVRSPLHAIRTVPAFSASRTVGYAVCGHCTPSLS